jgi:hypothetical protein
MRFRGGRLSPRARTTRVALPPLVCAFGLTLVPLPAIAFPPYRTTDAETAGADMLELRLGVLKLRRDESETHRSAPLSRINFGFGQHYEAISELEYAIDDGRFAEGALGFKWARLTNGRGLGVETLILLPVHSELDGSGIESQFIRTWHQQDWRLHVNVGGFYDPRSATTERGMRGSLLAEFPRNRLRPGVELFARDDRSTGTRIQAGVGLIASLTRMEIRAGLHVGLNDAAPDLEASVWFAWKWQLDRTAQ